MADISRGTAAAPFPAPDRSRPARIRHFGLVADPQRRRRAAVLALPWAWLALFLAAPAAIVLAIALAQPVVRIPPFSLAQPALDNFRLVLTDPLYRQSLLLSLEVAGGATLACLLAGYPMALAIARTSPRRRNALLLAVMLPFWTGFLMRLNAWIGLLSDGGWINTALGWAGIGPYRLLYTDAAMYIGMVYTYLPFMVLPLYARLSQLDPVLLEAASDLGAPPWRAFLQVTLPLSLPGVWAGILLVFIPAVGEYVIPELLGGPQAQMIGRVLWSEFFANRDWPTASALACVLLVLLLLLPGAVIAAVRTVLRRRGMAADERA